MPFYLEIDKNKSNEHCQNTKLTSSQRKVTDTITCDYCSYKCLGDNENLNSSFAEANPDKLAEKLLDGLNDVVKQLILSKGSRKTKERYPIGIMR